VEAASFGRISFGRGRVQISCWTPSSPGGCAIIVRIQAMTGGPRPITLSNYSETLRQSNGVSSGEQLFVSYIETPSKDVAKA
jgi:hypothetical protein